MMLGTCLFPWKCQHVSLLGPGPRYVLVVSWILHSLLHLSIHSEWQPDTILCDVRLKCYFQSSSYVSPPVVTNSGTMCACSLDRTLMNLLKSATLLRRRNSRSLSLRSRGCTMLTMCSLCDHVIHPAVASSVTNAWLGSMRFSSWTWLAVSVRNWASSSGRASPISVNQFTQSLWAKMCLI